MYKTILFDLDGTLTDSGLGITNSASYALKKYGIDVSDRKELNRFVGPPLTESFGRYYGIPSEKYPEILGYYREYYTDRGIFENEVYSGIPELLEKLKRDGKRLIVATSKPEIFAVQILEHFGIAKYFDFIGGAEMNESRTKKDEVIRYAIDACRITELSDVVMVGDREYDIIGAKLIGLDSVGVLYGYGSREELEKAGATFIAEGVGDIYDIVSG